ncbi:MAG: SCO family protein [Opitutaceae bacterium]
MKLSTLTLLPLLLAVVLPARASDPAPASTKVAPCCAEKEAPVVKKASCCDPLAPAAFSRDSLYQLDATFTDDTGHRVALGDLRGRPVLLTMFFSSCGYACPLLLGDLQRIRAGLTAEVRERTVIVLVSFDTQRDTPAALAAYRTQRQLDSGFVLLHAEAAGVRELAALLGVKFKQEADGNFAHSNLITVLNPAGEIAHQRSGLRDGLAETAAAVMLAASTPRQP